MKELIDFNKLPQHLAIIMDGNGRWAVKQGAKRVFGHKHAVKAVREVTEGCAELEIKYLTLYAFSTENWSRPKIEVDALMNLLVSTIRKEVPTLNKNNVRLHTIGDTDNLPKKCRKELLEAIKMTENNSGLNLVLALNYSGRWDILNAVKKIVDETAQGIIESNTEINVEFLEKYLSTNHIPDPELVIRTSGESRISNFLLWQIAYSELYISPILWPDFRKEHLYEAIIDYQKRERRFGKTSEQVRM